MKVSDLILDDIKIRNAYVYGLKESGIASGYAMAINTPDDMDSEELSDADISRMNRLGSISGGHDCFLKGITVQFDISLSQSAYQQLKRYHFIDCVTSTSTMHRITKLNIRKQCNVYVPGVTIDMLEEMVSLYNEWDNVVNKEASLLEIKNTYDLRNELKTKDDLFLNIVYSIPSGFMLTGRWTTNYMQLKTIYSQRKLHKLPEWRKFCSWCATELPNFESMCLGKFNKQNIC